MDTIPLCYQYCGPVAPARVEFHADKAGHYVDTARLIDPLSGDTIPLILIGDAYQAAVSQDPTPHLKLYPNPCDRNLTIELPDAEPADIEIRNLLGDTVYSSRVMSETSIDCSRLADGVYFARIRSGASAITRRIVVAH